MSESTVRIRRLKVLSSVCLVLIVPALVVWLVNVEVALRIFWPELGVLEALLPAWVFEPASTLSADLSSISTLVPVLLLLFPLWIGWRILRQGASDEPTLRGLVYDPYPPHFPFFLVMLGLAGTLYGLLIGLDVSGVAELGAGVPTPDQIQQSLDQLLGGTATALLSSLLGLLGAFLAARPLTALFQWTLCLPPEEGHHSLTETLRQLNHDLSELGRASREFSSQLRHTEIRRIPETLDQLRETMEGWRKESTSQQADLQEQIVSHAASSREEAKSLTEVLAGLTKILTEGTEEQRQSKEFLSRLVTLSETREAKLQQLLESYREEREREVERHREALERVDQTVRSLELLTQQGERAAGARVAASDQRSEMRTRLSELKQLREEDRQSLRRAVAQFLPELNQPDSGSNGTNRS